MRAHVRENLVAALLAGSMLLVAGALVVLGLAYLLPHLLRVGPSAAEVRLLSSQVRTELPEWQEVRSSWEYDGWNSEDRVWFLLKWRGPQEFYTEIEYRRRTGPGHSPWGGGAGSNALLSEMAETQRLALITAYAARHKPPVVATRPHWVSRERGVFEIGVLPLKTWNRGWGDKVTEPSTRWDEWMLATNGLPAWTYIGDVTAP